MYFIKYKEILIKTSAYKDSIFPFQELAGS
jgi:hypothetical protein